MVRARQPSTQTTTVLLILADRPAKWRHGYELCQKTGFKAGTMYPILMRLADRGWLETMWEASPPAGRPARHLYRLTGAGLKLVRELARPARAPARVKLRPRLEGA